MSVHFSGYLTTSENFRRDRTSEEIQEVLNTAKNNPEVYEKLKALPEDIYLVYYQEDRDAIRVMRKNANGDLTPLKYDSYIKRQPTIETQVGGFFRRKWEVTQQGDSIQEFLMKAIQRAHTALATEAKVNAFSQKAV